MVLMRSSVDLSANAGGSVWGSRWYKARAARLTTGKKIGMAAQKASWIARVDRVTIAGERSDPSTSEVSASADSARPSRKRVQKTTSRERKRRRQPPLGLARRGGLARNAAASDVVSPPRKALTATRYRNRPAVARSGAGTGSVRGRRRAAVRHLSEPVEACPEPSRGAGQSRSRTRSSAPTQTRSISRTGRDPSASPWTISCVRSLSQ